MQKRQKKELNLIIGEYDFAHQYIIIYEKQIQ